MRENDSKLESAPLVRRVRFAEFEADFELRELLKGGKRLPLQHKPFQILELLLRRPGSIVTRQELAHELWPGWRVSFERSLNTAVNALRLVLGDSSRNSRFVETRPGLGYRFIAPVEAELASPGKSQPPPANPDARQDCLEARYFLNKMTSGELHKAIAHFYAALDEDPDCTVACAGLAEAYSLLALYGAARAGDVCQQARALASACVQKNADLAEAHVSLALVKMIFDWDWAGARAACIQACQLAPQLPEAHRYQAALLSASSEHAPAETSARRACALEPLSLAAGTTLAWSLYLARDLVAAERQCWKMLMLEPRFSFAQTILGLVYEQQTGYTEAIIELENARLCSGGEPAPAAALGHAFAVSGERAKALTILEQLSGAGGAARAIVYCGLGEHSVALESLERAIHERDPLLLWLNVDPRLDPLRSHSRFQKMLQRVGFTKYNYT